MTSIIGRLLFKTCDFIEFITQQKKSNMRRISLIIFLEFGIPLYIFALLVHHFRPSEMMSYEKIFLLLALSSCWVYTILIWYAIRLVLPRFIIKVKKVLKKTPEIEAPIHQFCIQSFPVFIFWLLVLNTAYALVCKKVIQHLGFTGFFDPFHLLFLLIVAYIEFITALGFMGITMEMLLINWFMKIEKFKLDPYYPDGMGGFSIFGYITIRATIMFSMGGLAIPLLISSARIIGTQGAIAVYMVIGVYTFFLLLSFVLPNYSVFKKATKERKRILKTLGAKLTHLSNNYIFSNELASDETHNFIDIHTLYYDIRSVHVFPFNLSILGALASSVLFPLIMTWFEKTITRLLI
jgi:hypothetical protein